MESKKIIIGLALVCILLLIGCSNFESCITFCMEHKHNCKVKMRNSDYYDCKIQFAEGHYEEILTKEAVDKCFDECNNDRCKFPENPECYATG